MAAKKKAKGRNPGPTWTEALREFVKQLKAGKSPTDAHRIAYPQNKNPRVHACEKMKNPLVVQAMAEWEAIQKAAAQKAADADARKPVVTRREIEEGLLSEARQADTASARVRAWMGLAQIKGMTIQRTLDLEREFEGKTEEELDYFSIHGYFPDEQHLDAGKPGASGVAGESAPSQPADKKQ